MDIVVDHNHMVPDDMSAWSSRIMAVAKDMTADEVTIFKTKCNSAVWAALVFSNIRTTPARVLQNDMVGKTKISDWDLFPIVMPKPVSSSQFYSYTFQ